LHLETFFANKPIKVFRLPFWYPTLGGVNHLKNYLETYPVTLVVLSTGNSLHQDDDDEAEAEAAFFTKHFVSLCNRSLHLVFADSIRLEDGNLHGFWAPRLESHLPPIADTDLARLDKFGGNPLANVPSITAQLALSTTNTRLLYFGQSIHHYLVSLSTATPQQISLAVDLAKTLLVACHLVGELSLTQRSFDLPCLDTQIEHLQALPLFVSTQFSQITSILVNPTATTASLAAALKANNASSLNHITDFYDGRLYISLVSLLATRCPIANDNDIFQGCPSLTEVAQVWNQIADGQKHLAPHSNFFPFFVNQKRVGLVQPAPRTDHAIAPASNFELYYSNSALVKAVLSPTSDAAAAGETPFTLPEKSEEAPIPEGAAKFMENQHWHSKSSLADPITANSREQYGRGSQASYGDDKNKFMKSVDKCE